MLGWKDRIQVREGRCMKVRAGLGELCGRVGWIESSVGRAGRIGVGMPRVGCVTRDFLGVAI